MSDHPNRLHLQPDGSLLLPLRAETDGVVVIPPGHPDYARLLPQHQPQPTKEEDHA